jgi:hypothetical protein
MNLVSNEQAIDSELTPTVKIFSFAGLLPFIYFALSGWWPSLNMFDMDAIRLFQFYSVVILSFLAGTLWFSGLFSTLIQQGAAKSVVLRPRSLLWSGIFLSLLAWGNLFIDQKASLFVAALLFLVVWQVEQKTELSKCYPAWYTRLRAQLSMIVGALHMMIWLTIS